MILRHFIRETCKSFRLIWTSSALTMSNIIIETALRLILIFISRTHFRSWQTLYNFYSECLKFKRMNVLSCNMLDMTNEKMSRYYIHNHLYMTLRPFIRVTIKWFRFIWTSTTLTTSNNDLNGTKFEILTFSRKTHFHELRNTVYLCRLQPNYDSEWKMFTSMNFFRCNTRFDKKKISFFYINNCWNTILRPFTTETCKWYIFIWTSMTLTTSNNVSNERRLYLH